MADEFFRSFDLDRAKLDETNRRIPISFSSEFPVERWFGREILLHGEDNVDLSFLKRAGTILYHHDPMKIVGPMMEPKLENGRGVAVAGFDEDDIGNMCMMKVRSGSLRGISARYKILKFREVLPGEEYEHPNMPGKKIKGPAMVALKWMPIEASFTPIPEDPTVGAGRSMSRSLEGIEIETSPSHANQEGIEMEEKDVKKLLADELTPIRSMVEKLKVPTVEEVVTAVRSAIADEAKPRFRVDAPAFALLMDRAAAIGVEAEAVVARMHRDGKTEAEIQRSLLDLATGKRDASNTIQGGYRQGDPNKDGTREAVRSFKGLNDDEFFAALANPSPFLV